MGQYWKGTLKDVPCARVCVLKQRPTECWATVHLSDMYPVLLLLKYTHYQSSYWAIFQWINLNLVALFV